MTHNLTSSFWSNFYDSFEPIHAALSLGICVFGVLGNLVLIAVLQQQRLISTVNRLFIGIAIMDILLMLSNTGFLLYPKMFNYECPAELMTSYGWTVFLMFHSHFSVYCRACSLWLSVVIAIYRSYALSYAVLRAKDDRLVAMKLLRAVLLAVLIACTPLLFQNRIGRHSGEDTCLGNSSFFYKLERPPFALYANAFLLKICFWLYGILLKLLPCCLLSIFILRILLLVRSSRRHHKNTLLQYNQRRARASGQQHVRMSMTICIILLTTIICELPNSVGAVLSGVFDESFFSSVYQNLGDVFDLLSLLNCTTTSILYCSINREVASALKSLILDVIQGNRLSSHHRTSVSVKEQARPSCVDDTVMFKNAR